jgi:hypothetical protein
MNPRNSPPAARHPAGRPTQGRTALQVIRTPLLAIGAAAVIAVATGCGPGHHAASLASPTSSAVKADETAAAAIISQCMPENVITLTTKNGRKALVTCLSVPPAKRAPFETCVTTAAEHDHLATKAGRAELAEVSVPACFEENR